MPTDQREREQGPDARRLLRRSLPVDFPVTLEAVGGRRQVGSVANLSPIGLFVSSPSPFPVGTTLRVSLFLPLAAGSRRLVTAGQVRWINEAPTLEAPELSTGMGIEFVDLDARTRDDVQAFLDERLAPLAGRRPAGPPTSPGR